MMPTIASLSEDAMRAVAKGTKEASLALERRGLKW